MFQDLHKVYFCYYYFCEQQPGVCIVWESSPGWSSLLIVTHLHLYILERTRELWLCNRTRVFLHHANDGSAHPQDLCSSVHWAAWHCQVSLYSFTRMYPNADFAKSTFDISLKELRFWTCSLTYFSSHQKRLSAQPICPFSWTPPSVKHFYLQNFTSQDVFLFSLLTRVYSWDFCPWKISQGVCCFTNTHACDRIFIFFHPLLCLMWAEAPSTVTALFHAQHCCHTNGWLDNYMNARL